MYTTRSSIVILLIALFLCTFLIPMRSVAQDILIYKLNVFLDCTGFCDFEHIRREIPYVNYVRDQADAHVHLLITSERTGSGGRAFQLNYIGLGAFQDLDETLRHTSGSTDTSDEIRRGLTSIIAEGLARYVARTEMAGNFRIIYTDLVEQQVQPANPVDDLWNSWVFGISMSGFFSGEESSDFLNMSGGINADHVTEDWKFRFRANGNFSENNFDIGDETITSRTENGRIRSSLVRSISEHWSAGATFLTSTSSRQNQALLTSLSPAIEYNVFPYSESSRREIRIQYQLEFQVVDYDETTIFDKSSEKLLVQNLSIQLEFQQPWGSADVEVGGRNYITDFEDSRTDFYNVSISGFLNVRLVRGLFVNLGGTVSSVHDQLFLPKGGATDEEVLLRTKNLPTTYAFDVNFGLSYSFGSRYNNVVNTRFGF